ncbi:MAG: hypothetical protein NG747_01120 [Candidatus Brocadia sp.]|nr:hypothetical protein [Candidatus Brocadia sp.]
MKKLLGIFFAMFVAMALVSPVYAGPADDTAPKVGDDTSFFGVSVGKTLPPLCDNFGYVWYLEVSGPGTLEGRVDTSTCGVYNVTGTFDAVSVHLTASGGACCTSFTYAGTYSRASKTASGNWTNACGSSGNWTLAVCGKRAE